MSQCKSKRTSHRVRDIRNDDCDAMVTKVLHTELAAVCATGLRLQKLNGFRERSDSEFVGFFGRQNGTSLGWEVMV